MLCIFAEQRTGDPFVEQQSQKRNHAAFQQIQRGHTEEYEGGYGIDLSMDLGTHTDDGIQRDFVKLCEFGKQVDCVESTAENSDANAADYQTDDGAVLASADMIDNGGGKNQTAAHHKVSEITHKGSGSSLKQKLEDDFDTLTSHRCGRSQIKAAE